MNSRGFTYLELIIYMSILVIMLTALIPFAWNAIEGGVKSATEREVFSQGQYISERLQYEIRNASGITVPAVAQSGSQVSLATANPATNPTVFTLSNGNITMTQGSGSTVNLNSQNTAISALNFTNASSPDGKTENVQFTFTISANYPGSGGRQEYKASTTIEGDAEVRNN